MNSTFYADLFPVLAERSRLASICRLGFANIPLRRHLHDLFSRPYGQPGAFLADPAFEAVFGWKAGHESMDQLSQQQLLHPDLVAAMDMPPDDLAADYRFSRDLRPYIHQVDAWRLLRQDPPQSVVVSSGTGSGKTECFMVPVLDHLARLREQEQQQLVGVRALFLYPLNALINSQRERLRAWTNAFGDGVRFCLYNGNTPETLRAKSKQQHPNEVLDRKTLRTSPPPILVTNPTMLEYMLIRTEDGPILEKSQGKLKWVVLDEAHTYIGSQAAEAALLIRRVLLAFGMQPEEVHFIATSATIGNPQGKAARNLKQFLADIAGVSNSQVHLITGAREIPEIAEKNNKKATGLSELEDIDPNAIVSTTRYRELVGNKTARSIRDLFINSSGGNPVAKLSEVCRILQPNQPRFTLDQQHEALRWLDLLSGTKKEGKIKNGTKQEASESFLPLRAHLFHQTLSGIWACADSACPEKNKTQLDSPQWPFGAVYLEPRKHCICGSPAYEVVCCADCGMVYLLAEENQQGILTQPQPLMSQDEFELDIDQPDEKTEENEHEEEPVPPIMASNIRYLVVNRELAHVGRITVDRQSREIAGPGENTLDILVEEEDEEMVCPCCEKRESNSRGPLFRMSRLGAPFLLNTILPSLLEFAPDGQDKPADLPWRGRRLLTFNDSRQGTARMAISLQQGAERNTIRSQIYHLAIQHGQSGNTQEIAELEAKIATLEMVNNASLKDIIESEKAKLAKLQQVTPIPFMNVVERLVNGGRDFSNILARYCELDPGLFGGAGGGTELAKMLIVREFGRRPKYQNSLETMGMVAVHYPALDNIATVPPTALQASGFSVDEWRAFLKLCLDFFVRAGGSLGITPDSKKWLGLLFRQSWLREADAEEVGRNQRRWPRARRSGLRSTLVRLLAHVLRLDHQTAEGEDRIDAILQDAWSTLRSQQVLQLLADGYIQPLEQLAFAPMSEAWVCPVTRRLLDTTLRGVTPYLPEGQRTEANTICQRVQIPVYDQPFGNVSDMNDERIQRGREWIGHQPLVTTLREEGVWSDLQDRVIEMSPYFRTAEHSAQQSAATLQEYERLFRKGKVNILSCSTTMEMGIDIGGINQVAMNNVPPHPANYLQRAGRAGRRKEARSIAMTLCKANPLDQAVFSNTSWAFDSIMASPCVSLDSPIIVQRHIHSFLLNRFLTEKSAEVGLNQIKLTCGFFFGGDSPWSEQYRAWCADFSPKTSPELATALQQMTRFSVLENQSLENRTRTASEAMGELSLRWRREWEQLEQDRQEFARLAGPNAPVSKAITFRLKRLTDEYLLRELATQGYLPAYGFPSHIAAFDNLTVDQFKAAKKEQVGREDNSYQRRELASRDLATALREYAPGAEVVMNGRVFKSAGVTLNWHVPATVEQVNETQEIRHAWRCDQCGASGSSFSFSLRRQAFCAACNAPIKRENICEFLEPAGFSVDFYSEPHNNINAQQFVPVERPWINAEGDWASLMNPDLGRFRATPRGHLFHHSRGIHRTGYALCLACGRAEPMKEAGELPPVFQRPHRKLRRAKDEVGTCPGSEFSIKEGISLGHELRTDMVELQLKNREGIWLNDRVAARTIAVALRDSLAGLIGVQATELGCEVKQALSGQATVCQSILIYDNYAAGYASRADNWFAELFQKAVQKLHCSEKCDSACPHCVLDFDQRFAADSLDRHQALLWLNATWLEDLQLPEKFAFFGAASMPEHKKISEAILHAASRHCAKGVRCYTGGAADSWDIVSSSLRKLAYKLAGQDLEVEIILPEGVVDTLDILDRYRLAAMADSPRIQLYTAEKTARVGQGYLVAETFGGACYTHWAGKNASIISFNQGWGLIEEAEDILVRCDNDIFPVALASPLTPDALRPAIHANNDRILEVCHELDGSLQGFGSRFWQLILEKHPACKALLTDDTAQVSAIHYSDRYLKSPITASLLISLLDGLKQILGKQRWSKGRVDFITLHIQSKNFYQQPYRIWDDWQENSTRENVMKTLCSSRDLDISVYNRNKQDIPHKRELSIEFTSKDKLVIFLDMGVSYWQSKYMEFDFSKEEDQQARYLDLVMNNPQNHVKAGDSHPTTLAIKIVR